MELKNYYAQDSQGNVQPGVVCHLYVVGTDTHATGLLNAKDGPLTNPFNSDGYGLIQFKAPNGVYDLRIVSTSRDYRIRVQCADLSDYVDLAKAEVDAARAQADAARAQADRAQQIADDFASSGGNGGTLKDTGVFSGREYGVIGGATRDESNNINAAIAACGKAGGGTVIIRAVANNDPIYINGPVQIEYSNVTLRYESNILYGPDAMQRVSGSFKEIRRTELGQVDLISLLSDSTVDEYGAMKFTVRPGQGAYLVVGDRVTLRGLNDKVGNAIEKQTVTIAKLEGDVVTAYDDPEYTFRATYPTSEWEPDHTTGTTVSIVNYSAFANFSTGPNVNTVQVDMGSKFKAGDLVYLSDARREKDVMSPEPATLTSAAVMEIALVTSVDGNMVTLDRPLARTYLKQWNGGISQLDAVKNSHIIIKDISWASPQLSRKNSAVGINFGDGCTIKVASMRGQMGRVGSAVRIAYSFDCTVYDSQIIGGYRFQSAEAYGAVMYYSTQCRIKTTFASGNRHNFLLQTCTSCDVIDNESSDDYISGIDLHGAGSINCRILRNRLTRSKHYAPDSNKGGAIRNGNTSHMIGDHGTLIANNYIEGYNDSVESAAIDVSPSSKGVIIRDNHIVNSSIGVRHYRVADRAVVVQYTDRILVMGNTFEKVAKLIDMYGHATSVVRELVLIGNRSISNNKHFLIANVAKVTMIDNQIISPIAASGEYAFDVRDATDLYMYGNQAKDANKGLRLINCPNAKIIKNAFDYTIEAEAYKDGGGNTGLVYRGNTIADSGGSGATVQLGSVATGAPGTDVIITNTGTPQDAVFNFTIPRGNPGADGGGSGGGGANSQALDNVVNVANNVPMFNGTDMTNLPTGAAGRDILSKDTTTQIKETLGLDLVQNTPDIEKVVSNPTKTELDKKATIISPIFEGVPQVPHPLASDESKQPPTTAWVKARIAEIPPAPTGAVKAYKTFALFGDSLSGNNSDLGKNYTRGFLTFAQQMSGHRVYFDSSLNFGVGGDTAAMIAARVSTVLAAKPDICLVEMGGNDTGQSGITIESVIANTKTVVEALTNAGIYVILCTIYPTAGNTSTAVLRKVSILNQWIIDAPSRYNLLEVLDAGSVMFDNTTGLVRPNHTYDKTHPGGYGSWYLGRELAKKLLEIVRVSRYQPLNNIYDKWALDYTTGNILSNAQYTGTSGTITGSTGSGTIPDGLVLNTDNARGVTAAVSVIPGTDGFNTLEITLGGTATGTDPRYTTASHIYLGEVLGGTSAWNTTDLGKYMRDTAVNQLLQMECEVENLVGVAAVGVETFHLSSGGDKPSNGDGLYTVNTTVPTTSLLSLSLPTEATPVKLILRAEPEANTGKAQGYRVGIHIVCLPSMAVSGKIRISRPVLRAYPAKFK